MRIGEGRRFIRPVLDFMDKTGRITIKDLAERSNTEPSILQASGHGYGLPESYLRDFIIRPCVKIGTVIERGRIGRNKAYQRSREGVFGLELPDGWFWDHWQRFSGKSEDLVIATNRVTGSGGFVHLSYVAGSAAEPRPRVRGLWIYGNTSVMSSDALKKKEASVFCEAHGFMLHEERLARGYLSLSVDAWFDQAASLAAALAHESYPGRR